MKNGINEACLRGPAYPTMSGLCPSDRAIVIDVGDVRTQVAQILAAGEVDPDYWEGQFVQAQQNGLVFSQQVSRSLLSDSPDPHLWGMYALSVEDTLMGNDDEPGILASLLKATPYLRRGVPVGFDFSKVRPSGAWLARSGCFAAGPISFLKLYDQLCSTLDCGSHLSLSQMATLQIDHPDIDSFIDVALKGNLPSVVCNVAVTDAFMAAVQRNQDWQLVHRASPGDEWIKNGARKCSGGLWIYRTVRARDLWYRLTEAVNSSEKIRISFVDQIRSQANLAYVYDTSAVMELIEPSQVNTRYFCHAAIDLSVLVEQAFTSKAKLNEDKLKSLTSIAVRALNNLMECPSVASAMLPQAWGTRQVRLGVVGLSDALIMLGVEFDSHLGRMVAKKIMECMRDAAYDTSADLARQFGAFPMYAPEFLKSKFVNRLPKAIQKRIRQHGIRNASLLSLAPLDSAMQQFSKASGVSIMPVTPEWLAALKDSSLFLKQGSSDTHSNKGQVSKAGLVMPDYCVSAQDLTPAAYLEMMGAVREYVDTAMDLSFEASSIPGLFPTHDLYFDAWQVGLKSWSMRSKTSSDCDNAVRKPMAVEGTARPKGEDAAQLHSGA